MDGGPSRIRVLPGDAPAVPPAHIGIVTCEPITSRLPDGRPVTRATVAMPLEKVDLAALVLVGSLADTGGRLSPGNQVYVSGRRATSNTDAFDLLVDSLAVRIRAAGSSAELGTLRHESPVSPLPSPAEVTQAFEQEIGEQRIQHQTTRYLQAHGIRPEIAWQTGFAIKTPPAGHKAALEAAFRNNVTLWAVGFDHACQRVVVAERPLDVLAYRQMTGDNRACFVAIGPGWPDADKRVAIGSGLAKLPITATVISAFGRDVQGQRLAEEFRHLCGDRLVQRSSPTGGPTWCDSLVAVERDYIRSQGLAPYARVAQANTVMSQRSRTR